MDVLAEVNAGMSWRRFTALLAALSPDSMFRVLQRSGRSVQRVTGKDAAAFLSSLGGRRTTGEEVAGGPDRG